MSRVPNKNQSYALMHIPRTHVLGTWIDRWTANHHDLMCWRTRSEVKDERVARLLPNNLEYKPYVYNVMHPAREHVELRRVCDGTDRELENEEGEEVHENSTRDCRLLLEPFLTESFTCS